ncbi:MAG: hypothetical protein J6T22_08420 [Bacteroidales bacterium]|nr:hypothetical protein [Bacteroidales bacterium]
MKKLFLTLALAFAGIFAANAQVWIGGSTNATINKDVTHFAVAPEIGYCIPNTKWTVAVGADYTFQKYDGVDATHGLMLSPYIRYSVCNIEKFALFMDLTGDFALKGYEGYRVGLQPGIAWMATKHWTAAFRFAFIGYNHCDFYGAEGFRMNFATAAPGFGLYYNF